MKHLPKILILSLMFVSVVVPSSALAASPYYSNVSGAKVHKPVAAVSMPVGASAQCRDGSFSFSAHRSGTCSHHGGVKVWR